MNTLVEPSESPPHTSWTPLLDGPLTASAEATIDAIASDLRALDPASVSADLADGAAGIALFFAYLAEVHDQPSASAEAQRWLDVAFEQLPRQLPFPGLISGYTGVAWTALQLCDEATAREVCAIIDQSLSAHLPLPAPQGWYDLISGPVGIGAYLLLAPPSPTRDAHLRTIMTQLAELAVPDLGGRTWFTPPEQLAESQREVCPDGLYNLGLAHGVPGVIALLARFCAAGIERERAQRLVEDAMHWMLHVTPRREFGRYPSWSGRGASTEATRLAWCYGDPGVATAFLAAARAVGRADWHAEALDLARQMVQRSPDRAGIVDAGLCHGAAGLAHILGRLYQATGEASLAEAARYWLASLFKFREPGRGIGGFLALGPSPEGPVGWHAKPGFLMGSAGIGLALLAATSRVAPDWDQALLIDL